MLNRVSLEPTFKLMALCLFTLNSACGTSSASPTDAASGGDTGTAVVTPAPTPTPTPTPAAAAVVSPAGLSGEAVIADNFTAADGTEQTWYGPTGRGGVAGTSPDPVGAFRMFCHPGHIAKDDPLVLPGQPGASHAHQFVGNDGTDANSTYSSLRTTGKTTCGNFSDPEHPINRSAYWFPAMKDGAGSYVKPDYMNLYYKRNPSFDPYCSLSNVEHIGQCVDLPNGIRYVFGFNMKTMTGGPSDPTSQDHDAITFQCWASYPDGKVGNGGANGYYHSLEEVRAAGCPVGARVMIVAAAPNCWDGKNLDSADHRSHMHASDGPMYVGQFFRACPTSHPYVVPNLEVQIAFTADENFRAGKWHLSSDEMMAGATPGSTWHFDYWEAWSPTIKAAWHENCINKHLTCSGGDLGNGMQIKGSDLYPDNDYPKHQLVPAT